MSIEEVWKEREEAVGAMKAYLTDMPSKGYSESWTYHNEILFCYPATVAFVHGPQGSGKTRLLQTVLKEFDRYTILLYLLSSQSLTICVESR